MSVKSLKNLINKEALGNPVTMYLLIDNKKISLDKFKYDNIDYKNLRFLNTFSKNWIQMIIDKSTLNESDYLFPVMTQLVI